MTPMLHVRKRVLKLTQAEFAAVAAVSQGTVSKWENGELEPSREELGRIRDEARRRGIAWDDRWFFDKQEPNEVVSPASQPERAGA